jgi:hypothetical protein
MSPEFDRLEVVAEVRTAVERYERTLADGDVAVMTELFWDDPRCVRSGSPTGSRAPTRSRLAPHAPVDAAGPDAPGHLAVDDRTAVVTTLIHYSYRAIEGRQSQPGVRHPEGWRVVEARVSELSLGS